MHLSQRAILIFTLALALAVSGCCACCETTPTPDDNSRPSGNTYSNYYQSDPGPSSGDIQKSSSTLSTSADALDTGDQAAFELCLTNEAKKRYSLNEMSADGAKKLAEAIRNARIVKQYSNEILYETTIDGETYYFSTTKEGGEWKIDSI
ncbi:hypothetical protein CUJ83_09855 [Methanocella sp. CWC-04]|uniref:Lipoprotein n=1 Tax=Methanooceanicella nereidis TaxID=2052831 RepID=A0AAP2W6G6_9EURY|nr:hypothetical protein [Methanocella sp. CWC-04]MCD1295303.1 hypothetical protein [Methanocella sp. CWC-04]